MARLMTVSEVADRLHVRRETVRGYIGQGKLPAVQLPGGYFRIREKDLANFLQPVKKEAVEV